jgi:hypothetical protein
MNVDNLKIIKLLYPEMRNFLANLQINRTSYIRKILIMVCLILMNKRDKNYLVIRWESERQKPQNHRIILISTF